jgi:hypothetical protein
MRDEFSIAPGGADDLAPEAAAEERAVDRYLRALDAGDAAEIGVDLAALEREFARAAKPYADRLGITYETWVDAGVSPELLDRAGIDPPRRPTRRARRLSSA